MTPRLSRGPRRRRDHSANKTTLGAALWRPPGRSGERGIRTPGTRKGSTVFKTDAIVRSAISP